MVILIENVEVINPSLKCGSTLLYVVAFNGHL